MKLIRASAHTLNTKFGTKLEYVRLTYRTAYGILGQSLPLSRLSPDLQALARSNFVEAAKERRA